MNKLILTISIAFFAFSFNAKAQGSQPPGFGDCDIMDGFRTQTIGGWGADPSGNNSGTYLHANFSNVFGMGLTVGTGANTVSFTSAAAITAYLPATGTPMTINDMYINPMASELRNTLVSQVVALTLSLGFDAADADFAGSDEVLGSLVIASGDFQGKTVSQMLAIANSVLSGENTDYTASAINEAISAINENFVDGNITGMFLACPF